MGPTGNFVVSPAHDLSVFYHHCADRRIRRRKPFALGCKIQSHIHEMTVIHNFSEIRGYKTEVGRQKSEDRGQKTEDRGQIKMG
jgi:hypothetical protein